MMKSVLPLPSLGFIQALTDLHLTEVKTQS